MSGVSDSNRIQRKDFMKVLDTYEKTILNNIKGYKSLAISGSFNSDMTKNDFGDMDIIINIDTSLNKKELKKSMTDYFKSLPDDIILPFTSKKYRGRKYYNSGEIVTISFPQPDGSVQIDNIIALSDKEMNFKQNFLDLPAEKQGLVLGLVKVSVQENNSDFIHSILGHYPEIESNEEYEFNLSSVELQLRAIITQEVDGKIKQVSKRVIWSSTNWKHVINILRKYDLSASFDSLIERTQKVIMFERSLIRIEGIFKSMITVKSGEVGKPKGINKEMAIAKISNISKGL
jgi:hypothetical protein